MGVEVDYITSHYHCKVKCFKIVNYKRNEKQRKPAVFSASRKKATQNVKFQVSTAPLCVRVSTRSPYWFSRWQAAQWPRTPIRHRRMGTRSLYLLGRNQSARHQGPPGGRLDALCAGQADACRGARPLYLFSRWQAAQWPGSTSRNSGTDWRHASVAYGHRVWKRQPVGGFMGEGISP